MAPPSKRSRTAKPKPSRPAKIRRVKEVLFDEDARKEFLTGFSKRKKQRENAVRTKAIEREKEELRESRKAIRLERKERAALNVKNAKALYGDLEDSDDGEGSSSNSEDGSDVLAPTAEYESSELVTTVVVESFRLSRSPSPIPLPTPSTSTTTKPTKPNPSPATEAHKKRVRNRPAFRPKMTREDKRERSTGGKRKKAGFLKGNAGTKGKANRG